MASLVNEAKQFTEPKVLKDLAFAAGGFYGTHIGSRMIPVGSHAGWEMVIKDAVVAAGIGWATAKFLGDRAGEAAFTGGGLYTVLDGVGVATHGEYGLNGTLPAAAAPAALPAGSAMAPAIVPQSTIGANRAGV